MLQRISRLNIPKVDLVEPFYIGNFIHKRSLICTDLLNEAQNLLISLGYNGDFTMYYHLENPSIVRLYFKISYVSVIYIDGGWDEIKRDMQTFVSYVIAFQNIRKHADKLTCCWIEQNAKEIDWISEDYTKNAIQKYKTEL